MPAGEELVAGAEEELDEEEALDGGAEVGLEECEETLDGAAEVDEWLDVLDTEEEEPVGPVTEPAMSP